MLQILILRKTKKHRPRSYCIPHVIRFKAVVNDRKSQKIEIALLHLMKTLLLSSTQGDIA